MLDARDVTVGLSSFSHMTSTDCVVLVKLLARVAEHAYRRGVCHAIRLTPDEWPSNPARWRFGLRLDVAPILGSTYHTRSTIALLFEQHPKLRGLGLAQPPRVGVSR